MLLSQLHERSHPCLIFFFSSSPIHIPIFLPVIQIPTLLCLICVSYVSLKNHCYVPNCVTVTPTTGSGARLFPPFQRVRSSLQFQGVNMTPFIFRGGGLAKYWMKEDYFWELRSKSICLARFWTCLRSVIPSFLLISSFWNRNIHPIPAYHCILEVHNMSGFTVHSWREFCLKMNHTSNLKHTWLQWHLDKTLEFIELMLEWVKTLGAIRVE